MTQTTEFSVCWLSQVRLVRRMPTHSTCITHVRYLHSPSWPYCSRRDLPAGLCRSDRNLCGFAFPVTTVTYSTSYYAPMVPTVAVAPVVYSQPAYVAPVYSAPVYAAAVYVAPVF